MFVSNDLQDRLLSYRVVIVSSWIFFILINAYYGGALTMFFSSAPSPPFSSVREALTLYPEWKMILPDGLRVLINYKATELKDPPFVKFYERANQPNQVPTLLKVPNVL